MKATACLLLLLIFGAPAWGAKVRHQVDWSQPTILQEESTAEIMLRRKIAETWVQKHVGNYRQFLDGNLTSTLGQYKDLKLKDNEDKGAPSNPKVTSLCQQAWLLQQDKKLSRENMAIISKILANRQERYFEKDSYSLELNDSNIYYYKTAAYARALAPGRYRGMERLLGDFLSANAKNKGLEPDNSTAKSSTCIAGYIEMCIVAGKFDSLKSNAALKVWLEKLRDMVAPNGSLPVYGSSSVEGRLYSWPFMMEAGALLYDDPSFLYTADKLHIFHQTRPKTYQQIEFVRLHALLPERTNTFGKMTPVAPAARSLYIEKPKACTKIGGEQDEGHPYKLVLRSGNHTESAYVCVDIGTGRSLHIMQRGAISSYVANGVNLLQGPGGRFLAQQSDMVVMTTKGQPFPMMQDQFALKGYAEYQWDGPEDKELKQLWHLLEPQDRRPVVEEAMVEQRALDAYARVTFKQYADKSGSLTRQLVLTPEGVLIVRDDLRAGRDYKGGLAGPIWKFGNDSHGKPMDPESEGANYFIQRGIYNKGLLCDDSSHFARMFVGFGLKGKLQRVGRNLSTVYVHQPVDREELTFLSIMLPLGKEDGGEFAKKLKSVVPPDGGPVAVRIPKANGHITVTIDRKGKWNVNRTPGILIPPGTLKPVDEETRKKYTEELATQLAGYSDEFAGKSINVKGRPVEVVSIQEGAITCKLGEKEGDLKIVELPYGDQARLAFLLTKLASADPDANAVAAFYLLALNKKEMGRSLLIKAGNRSSEIKQLFGLR